MQQWIIDEITSNLTKIRNRRLSSLYKREVIALDNDLTGLQISDMNARETYNEIKIMAETIGNLPLEFDNFGYMPNLTYIDVNWVAISKKRAEMANGIRIKINLKRSSNINKNDKPSGSRFITLNHVDEDKIDTLKDFTFVYGDELCVYKFDSGKRISIYAEDKQKGVKAINKLMNAVVETKKKRVKVADLEPSNPKKDPHSLSGIKASFDSYQILDGDENEC